MHYYGTFPIFGHLRKLVLTKKRKLVIIASKKEKEN
jgi:hypothetical protein